MTNKRGNEPTDEVFEDMRQAALKTWEKYDDTYGYRTEKTSRVNELTNYADNWYTFLGMFDGPNQAEFRTHLKLIESEAFLQKQLTRY